MPYEAGDTATERGRRRHAIDLKDYDAKMIDCRTYLHAWRPLGIYRENTEDGGMLYVDVAVCTRCRTLRERSMDALGELTGNAYIYAAGYAIPGGATRRAFRVEMLRRHGAPKRDRNSVVPAKYRE